jgi:membrane protein DedA with SNARE-associated domain
MSMAAILQRKEFLMSLESMIMSFGYPVIFIGTLLEGETILILGGFAARCRFLELHWVVLSAFFGTLFGDQLYFYIGRIKGMEFLERKPHWKLRTERVFQLLRKHQIAVLLGFRFLYGIRTVTPFLIGTSGISPFRFLILNMISAGVWAIVIGSAGYLFGQAVELVIKEIKQFEIFAFGIILLIGVIIWIIHWRTVKRRNALK